MTTQLSIAELRDTVTDILESLLQHPSDGNVAEAVFAIVSAAQKTFTEPMAPRRGTLVAMANGLNRCEAVKAKLGERFRMNYLWTSQFARDILEWLMERPEAETIDKFADWWYKDEWRRTRRGSPSLQEIYTFWPQAFGAPQYQSDESKPAIFRAGGDDE